MKSSSLASVRAVTTSRRPPGNHGCPGVEIVPGLWTAHFHDIETLDALRSVAPPVTVVVNVGTDKCPVVSYGGDVRVVAIDLLDDPDELKAADGLPEGSNKDGVKSALLGRLARGDDAGGMKPCGDARKDFEAVNSLVDETPGGGGGGPDTLPREHIPIRGIRPRLRDEDPPRDPRGGNRALQVEVGSLLARGLVRIAAHRVREGAGTVNTLFGKLGFHASAGVLTVGRKLGTPGRRGMQKNLGVATRVYVRVEDTHTTTI